MKPTYREKNLLDYLFGGFRSTLKKLPQMPASRFLKIVQETGQNSSAVSTCQFLLPGTTLYGSSGDPARFLS